MEAASEEFARHGFAGARIEAIAERTRLNVRMIYYHFRSKEGLYAAVLEAIYRHMARILDETSGAADLEGGPVAAFGRYVDLLGAHPRFADILVREAIDGGRRLAQLFSDHPELYERVHRGAYRLLEQSIEAGLMRKVDPVLVVHSLTGMVCLLVASREALPLFTDGQLVEPAQWKNAVVDLFLHGLAARPPAAPEARALGDPTGPEDLLPQEQPGQPTTRQ